MTGTWGVIGAPTTGGASTIAGVTGLQAALDARAPTARGVYAAERDTLTTRLRDLKVTSPHYLVLDNFTSVTGWAGASAAAATVDGSATLRVIGSSGANYAQKNYGSAFAITDDLLNVYMRLYVTDPVRFYRLRVYLYDSTGSNGYVLLVSAPTGGWVAGWQTRTFKRSEFSTVGTAPGWNVLTQMRITTYANDSVNFDTIYVDEVSLYAMRPVCSIWFDDGHPDVMSQALPAMAPYGFTGSMALQGRMDYYSPHMTPAQHRELLAAGWDISNHTYTHPDLTTLDEAGQRAEIARGVDVALKLGAGASAYHLVPPMGRDDATTRVVAGEYATLMRNGAGRNPLPVQDFYALKSQTPLPAQDISVVYGWIDQAIAEQEWLILLFHLINDSGSANSYQRAKFDLILAYLDSHRADIDTLPPSLAIARM